MRSARVLLLLGVCWMAGAIVYGFVAANIPAEAHALIHLIWFWISMADLYTGLMLFSGWILFRERSLAAAVVWIFLLVTLGNLASCAYALIALLRSRGDWRTFWMGSRSGIPDGSR